MLAAKMRLRLRTSRPRHNLPSVMTALRVIASRSTSSAESALPVTPAHLFDGSNLREALMCPAHTLARVVVSGSCLFGPERLSPCGLAAIPAIAHRPYRVEHIHREFIVGPKSNVAQ